MAAERFHNNRWFTKRFLKALADAVSSVNKSYLHSPIKGFPVRRKPEITSNRGGFLT